MNNKGDIGTVILLTLTGLIIFMFVSCHDNNNDKSSVSINAGYHSDYWYDRKHAKENADKKVEELKRKNANKEKGMIIYDGFGI